MIKGTMAGASVMCPFEIGDKVQQGVKWLTITDIIAVYSVKLGETILLYEFDNSGEAQKIIGNKAGLFR